MRIRPRTGMRTRTRSAFYRGMMFFYGAMAGVPFLIWLVAMLSPFPQFFVIRIILLALAGFGSIVFGIFGYREVFIYG